ncbi:hypothetical protein BKA70DRAFT_1449231 [Coprinopsis sp. MPI-PUGE-AT-0042]|nr:hypothetical protein BKA70DRAFT_1449231 [Coprinopsis sp. MPI-PUGE-AT-0042]
MSRSRLPPLSETLRSCSSSPSPTSQSPNCVSYSTAREPATPPNPPFTSSTWVTPEQSPVGPVDSWSPWSSHSKTLVLHPPAPPSASSADVFFRTSEMLMEMCQWLTWSFLLVFSKVSRHCRRGSQDEAARRIHWAIKPVLRQFGLQPKVLLSILGRFGGAIVGRAASRAMAYGMDWEERYTDLRRVTVLIPKGAMISVVEEFKNLAIIGFEHVRVDWSGEGASVHVRSVREAAVAIGSKLFYLRLVESKGSLLRALTTSSSTADMIAIMQTHLYVLYPHLVRHNLAIERWRRIGHAFTDYQDVKHCSPWPLDCRRHCPAEPRMPRAGEGIGVFFWNGTCEEGRISSVVALRGPARMRMGKALKHPEFSWEDGFRPDRLALKALEVGDLLEPVASFKWALLRSCPNESSGSHRQRNLDD